MERTSHTGSLIGGLLIGALAGAVLGILFAPNKGSITRSNITDGAKDMANNLKHKMESEAKDLRRKAKDFEHSAKEKFEEMKDNFHHKTETV